MVAKQKTMDIAWRRLRFNNTSGEEWIFVTSALCKDILAKYMQGRFAADLTGESELKVLMLDPDEPYDSETDAWDFYTGPYRLEIKPEHVYKMMILLAHVQTAGPKEVFFPTADFTVFMKKHWFDLITKELTENKDLIQIVETYEMMREAAS